MGSWLELFAIQLAGRVRAPEFIDRLVHVVGEDGDYANECAVDSLVSIGTVEVVNAARATYPEAGWDFRNFSPSVLGRIHLPESERALLELLALETDEFHRTSLAMALCDLFTTDGIDVVHRMAADGAYDGGLVDLRGLLAQVCVATGLTIPEMDGWIEQSRKPGRDVPFGTTSLKRVFGRSTGWVPTSKKRKKKRKKKR